MFRAGYMRIQPLLGALCIAACLVAAAHSPGAVAETCRLERLIEAPMKPRDNFSPVITIEMDGMPRDVLLDTGGFWSMVSPEIASGYTSHRAVVTSALGLQGLPLTNTVKMPSVAIGPAKFSNIEFYIAPPRYIGMDATLGANWLSNFDIEIDPVTNKASFFSHDHCEGAVVYWPHQDLAVVPFELVPVENHVRLTLLLDGKKVNAMLDTGAPETVLNLQTARRLFDITPNSPGITPTSIALDKRGHEHQGYGYQFKSLEMGEITFNNPRIYLAEIADSQIDMILGMHQLHGLHLYFAYKEKKLYATSARGDIAARTSAGEKPQPDVPMTDPMARVNARQAVRDAETAANKQDLKAAADLLDRAIQFDPGYADAYIVRAELHIARNEASAALADFDRAVQIDPTNPELRLHRIQGEFRMGDKQKARADLDQLLSQAPAYAPALRARAHYEFADGMRDTAFTDMTEAIRAAPNDPDSYAQRAHLYAMAGDYGRAYEDQTIVAKMAPKSAVALNDRCWYEAILGKLDEAKADCDAALEMSPRSPAALDSRGFVYSKQRQWGRAITDYSAALTIAPKLASSLYGRGLAKQQNGDAAGGDADIVAAQAIDPDIAQHFGK